MGGSRFGLDNGATVLTEPVNNASFVDVVGRHLELHAIAGSQADEALPHFARDVGEDDVIVCELHAEHRPGEHGGDLAF